jgi:drug/metabolite transporter (DMT)-like permease
VPRIDFYTIMLLLTSIGWAVYSVWGKHLVRDIHPLPMFTAVAVYSTLCFWGTAEAVGSPRGAWSVGAVILIAAAASGAVSIAGSHACHHYAQKYLGAAFCGSMGLLNPLVTYGFALIILPNEHLTGTQWLGAIILSSGTLAILFVGQRVHQPHVPAQALTPSD